MAALWRLGDVLDDVEVTFAGQDADLKATMSSFGGVTISGRYTFRGEELHIAMGGLLFENSLNSVSQNSKVTLIWVLI